MPGRRITYVCAYVRTGDVEVETDNVHVLNEASRELPFTTATSSIKNEEVRLRYRYLDLRRAQLQQNLVARSAIVSALREVGKRPHPRTKHSVAYIFSSATRICTWPRTLARFYRSRV